MNLVAIHTNSVLSKDLSDLYSLAFPQSKFNHEEIIVYYIIPDSGIAGFRTKEAN